MNKILITQGEHAVGRRKDDVIATILGSCVSICLYDTGRAIGGMNHMLLADMRESASEGTVGAAEIERLINNLRRLGADASRLRAKVFGGASMLAGMTDIGERNASFALAWLERESIPLEAKCVGGSRARQILFTPTTGKVKQRFVAERPREEIVDASVLNGVEMF